MFYIYERWELSKSYNNQFPYSLMSSPMSSPNEKSTKSRDRVSTLTMDEAMNYILT